MGGDQSADLKLFDYRALVVEYTVPKTYKGVALPNPGPIVNKCSVDGCKFRGHMYKGDQYECAKHAVQHDHHTAKDDWQRVAGTSNCELACGRDAEFVFKSERMSTLTHTCFECAQTCHLKAPVDALNEMRARAGAKK